MFNPPPPPIPFKDEFQVKNVQHRCNSTQPQLSSILTLPSATSVVNCYGSFFNFGHYISYICFNMFVWCVFCIYFLSVNIWYSLKKQKCLEYNKFKKFAFVSHFDPGRSLESICIKLTKAIQKNEPKRNQNN